MNDLLDIMRRLRAPEGCPWDREQTHASLRPYLLEEASEAVDALSGGTSEDIVEELGDVLLQIAFHAVIAEESGRFGYRDIEAAIVEKLVRRHPHVFADTEVDGADEVVRNWQAIKAKEGKPAATAAEAVPRHLPALMRARELGKGLGWPQGSQAQVAARLASSGTAEQRIGQTLLAVVDYARSLGVEPETALRDALHSRMQSEDGSSEAYEA